MWKPTRPVQFAVGAVIIVIVFRWLITGDLLYSVEVATSTPEELQDGALRAGVPVEQLQTKTSMIWSAVWPMLFEAVCWVGLSGIMYGLKLWDFITGLIDGFVAKQQAVEPSLAVASSGQPESPATDIRNLMLAIATLNPTEELRMKTKIRRPYAIAQLTEAVQANDFAAAEALLAELNNLSQLEKTGFKADPITDITPAKTNA